MRGRGLCCRPVRGYHDDAGPAARAGREQHRAGRSGTGARPVLAVASRGDTTMAGRTHYLSTVACVLALAGLRPASAGSFESLYQFTGGADGGSPVDGAVWGPDHSLYGTASTGGSAPQPNGTVFQLAPPVRGSTVWTLATLYSFTGESDGGEPVAGLAADSSGR